MLSSSKATKKVVSTDISDYYARVNFHRLENLLDEIPGEKGPVRFIKKHIKFIRAKQSFGLPVGGSAARLLSELALSDTDQALFDKGLRATRFVDDFRVFLSATETPYDALGYLAEQLAINEGLSLNAAKTAVTPRREYARRLDDLTSDVSEEAEGVALDALTADLYFEDEPDEKDLEQLKGINLVELLKNEIEKELWDIGRIRVIFRALKIAKPQQAINYIKDNFSELNIFSKEIYLLMETLVEEESGCFDGITDEVLDSILSSPASSVQLIRTWLLEIFVRGITPISLIKLRKVEGLSAVIDKRQLLLIRGRCDDKNYFRKQKTAIQNFSEFELPCLVWGASCLPKDEYEKWIDHLKGSFNKPLGGLFLRWASANRNKLMSKLKAITVDHPD